MENYFLDLDRKRSVFMGSPLLHWLALDARLSRIVSRELHRAGNAFGRRQ
jgi:hypothetical protein